ncbi:MAG: tetratricopeptide repeat protein, partial [Nitrospinota bacterium]
MAFRLFPVLLLIFLAFLYIAFFNPGNLTFTYAPGNSVSIPIIAVVTVSFLAGALCLALLYLAQGFGGAILSIRHSYGRWMDSRLEGSLKKAREFAQGGEREKALNSLEKIVLKKPEHFDALLLKGTLLREAGETKKAMAAHSLAISQRPADRDAIMELKDDYVRAGYLSSAYKLLEQTRGRHSGDAQVLVEMRHISEKLKDFKLAILLQKEVLRLAKNENDIAKGRYKLSVLHCRHARDLINAGDVKKAKKELSFVQKLDSAFLPAQIMQSEAALKLGKTGQAESILRDIFIKTSSVIPLRIMENMFKAGGKANEIEGVYDWAASTRPQKKILLLFLAMARIEKSDYKGAAQALD